MRKLQVIYNSITSLRIEVPGFSGYSQMMVLSHAANKRLIAFIVSLALFMDALDATIINTAIPAMAHSLQVNPVDLKIALISYLISLAIFIPISGWLADSYGVKRVFIIALIIFTISSIFCGYATTLFELVVARFIQGLGGSLMLPLGRLIVLRTFQRHELVDSMNHIIMVVSVGLMLGPLAGGFITDHLSWPWIFWVNIPVGIITILLASYWFVDTTPRKVRPLDIVGFILFGGGLAGLTFALSDLSETTADASVALSIMAISIMMLALYLVRSKKHLYPIVNAKLFQFRTFRISIIGNLCSRFSFGGVPFLLPLLLQVGLHYSAQMSGLLIAPIALGVMTVKSISLPVLRFFGYKNLLILNTILICWGVWAFWFVNENTPVTVIAFLAFIYGFLISMQYSALNSLGYAELSQEDMSSATPIMSTTQQLSQSFGVAITALLLRYYSSTTSTTFALTPEIFHHTFLSLGTLTLFAMFIFIRMMKPSDGQQMLTGPAQKKIEMH